MSSGEECLERVTRGADRSDRARRLAARHGRPGDADAAARAAGGLAGRADLRPRRHRVGGARRSSWAPSTFVEKPLQLDKTMLVVGNALRQRTLEAENRALRAQGRSAPDDGRRELRHAAAARAGGDGRADQRPRADLRRERHRQGAGRADDPRAEPPPARGRSSRSTAPRSRKS